MHYVWVCLDYFDINVIDNPSITKLQYHSQTGNIAKYVITNNNKIFDSGLFIFTFAPDLYANVFSSWIMSCTYLCLCEGVMACLSMSGDYHRIVV